MRSRITVALLIPTCAFGLIAANVAFAANCADPWVTTAVTEVLRRAPPSSNAPECNINLYNGGHWSSYKELRGAVGTYWGTHSYPAAPVAAAPSLTLNSASVSKLPSGTQNGQPVVNYNGQWMTLVASGAGNYRLVATGAGNIMINNGANVVSHDGASIKH